MDISNIGQSVEIMRKVLEKAVAPGIDDLRGRMTIIEDRVTRIDSRLDRIDNRMDSINLEKAVKARQVPEKPPVGTTLIG